MHSERGRHGRSLSPIPRFRAEANAPVQPYPLPGRDPSIDDFVIQGMAKTVARGHGAIGPGLCSLRVDEPPLPCPRRTALVDALFRLGYSSCDGSRGKGGARDAGRFEEGLLIRRELLELLLDKPSQTLWNDP